MYLLTAYKEGIGTKARLKVAVGTISLIVQPMEAKAPEDKCCKKNKNVACLNV